MVASSSSGGGVIPEDVVFQILVWLPVASLVRFRSVCKSWLSHIDSSRFISRHAHRVSDLEDSKLFAVHPRGDSFANFGFSLIFVSDLQHSNYFEFPLADLRSARIVSSFNGVICVICLTHKIEILESLWNPATKQLTLLPPPQPGFKYRTSMDIGFGFDVKTNDYMVVRVVVQDREPFKCGVEVYSLSRDSWRAVDAVLPDGLCIDSHLRKPFRNEIYCWLGYDWRSDVYSVISFNFSNETLGILPLPDHCEYVHEPVLGILKEKISCIISEHRNDLRIWILNEYGVKESWTKLYDITLDQVGQPMGFSMDGKVILKLGSCQKFYLCDPLTKEVDVVGIYRDISDIAVYKESLVSVRSANGVTKMVACECHPRADDGAPSSEVYDCRSLQEEIFVLQTLVEDQEG